jgi:hypothetical protein
MLVVVEPVWVGSPGIVGGLVSGQGLVLAWTAARGATAYRPRQMREARGKLRLCSQARVLGVALFDFKHAQTGVAPNAIELHPILGFACLSR